MSPQVAEIIAKHRSGARVSMRRATGGKGHVKVKTGPLNLLTKRYELDEAEYEELKRLLRALA